MNHDLRLSSFEINLIATALHTESRAHHSMAKQLSHYADSLERHTKIAEQAHALGQRVWDLFLSDLGSLRPMVAEDLGEFPAPAGPRWQCPECLGFNCQVDYGTWYFERADYTLELIEQAESSGPQYVYCQDCDNVEELHDLTTYAPLTKDDSDE